MAGGVVPRPVKAGADEMLDQVIDGQRVRARTILFLAVATLAMVGDGFDLSAIGYVTPELARQWHVSPGSLSPMLSAGIVGLLVGAPVMGLLGDRLGRKATVLGGLCLVGVASLFTAFADTAGQFVVLRFVTGLGLGGVIPNIIALTAELAPRRLRGMFVVIVNFGVPAGISLPGFVAARFVPQYGWPVLMVVGGVLPLLIAALAAAVLPESVRFLARRGDRTAEVARSLQALRPDLSGQEAARIARLGPAPAAALGREGGSAGRLFAGGLGAITPALWLTLAANQMVNFFALSWLPTLLQKAGSTTAQAGISASMFSLGGLLGGACLLFLVDRFGVVPTVVLFFLGVPTLAAIGTPGLSAGELSLVIACAGFCVSGNNFGSNAILGMIYPTPVRSLGTGWAQAMGRAGSLLAPVLGGFLLEMELPLQDLVLVPAAAMAVGTVASVGLALLCLRRFGSLRVHDAPGGGPCGRRRRPWPALRFGWRASRKRSSGGTAPPRVPAWRTARRRPRAACERSYVVITYVSRNTATGGAACTHTTSAIRAAPSRPCDPRRRAARRRVRHRLSRAPSVRTALSGPGLRAPGHPTAGQLGPSWHSSACVASA